MGRVVLVTGVSRDLGARFVRQLAADPSVDRVIAVDVVPPRADLGEVSFVRADIRNPVIAKVIAGQEVDTVVHMSVQSAPGPGGGSRTSAKEHNVIGTMQLLAACQKTPGVERLVLKSSSRVYGSSSRDPAMFTEDMDAKKHARTGYAKDVLEVEGYVRGFARRRPDVAVTLLRAANAVGPTVSTPLSDYFRLPVVPTVMGHDPRLQLLHENDLLGVLRHSTLAGVHGTFNVAGDGVLMLSQALRRLGRVAVPVPGIVLSAAGTVTRRASARRLQNEITGFLVFGRGIDTTAMHEQLGFHPAYTTAEAFADFARSVVQDTSSPRRPGGHRGQLVAAAAPTPGGDRG